MNYNPNLFPKEFTFNQSQQEKQETKLKESIEISQQLSQSNIDNFEYQVQNQNSNINLLEESNTTSLNNISTKFFRENIIVEEDTMLSKQLEVDDLSLFNEGLVSYKVSVFDEGIISKNYSKLSGYIECPDTKLTNSSLEISPNSALSIHGMVTCSSSSTLSIDGKIDGTLIKASSLESTQNLNSEGNVTFSNIGEDCKFTSNINTTFNSNVNINGSLISNQSSYFKGLSTFSGLPVIQSDYLIFESVPTFVNPRPFDQRKQTIYCDSNLEIFSERASKVKSQDFISIGLPLEYIDPDFTLNQNYVFDIVSTTNFQRVTFDKDGNQIAYNEFEKGYEKYLNQGVYIDKYEANFQHYQNLNIISPQITIPNESNWGFIEAFSSYTTNYLHAQTYTIPLFSEEYNEPYSNNEGVIGDKDKDNLSRVFTEYDYNRKVKYSLVPVGCVQIYAGFDSDKPGYNIPRGWVICDGLRFFGKNNYPELFEAIGTKFNSTYDSDEVVRVPDLRGLFIMGSDPYRESGEQFKDGQISGSYSISLNSQHIPRHKHNMNHSHSLDGSGTHTHAMNHTHNSSSNPHTHSIHHNHSINDPRHSHGFVDQSGSHIPYVITEYKRGQPGRGGGTWEDTAPDCYGTSRESTGIEIQQFSGNSGGSNSSITIGEYSGRTGNNSSMSLSIRGYEGETEEVGTDTGQSINITPRNMALIYIIKVTSDFD